MSDSKDTNLSGETNPQGGHYRFCPCPRCAERGEGYFGFFKTMSLSERIYYTCQVLAWTEDQLTSLTKGLNALRMDLVTLGESLGQ